MIPEACKTVQDDRQDGNYGKSNCSDKDDAVKHFLEILTGGLTRTDTRYEAAALFHIVCDLKRIECNGGVEICKSDKE